MSFTVDLQPFMTFHIIWMFAGLILLTVSVILGVLCVRFRPERVRTPRTSAVARQVSYPEIRTRYLKKIDELERRHKAGEIPLREAYMALSKEARGFVREMTGDNPLNMTLSELKAGKYQSLSKLVNDYYEPEFAFRSDSNFTKSCERTRRMIGQWK